MLVLVEAGSLQNFSPQQTVAPLNYSSCLMQQSIDNCKTIDLRYLIFSDACSIELVDSVVVTGGSVGSLVQVYTTAGHLERLPDLITARYHHACAHYVDSSDRVVRQGV